MMKYPRLLVLSNNSFSKSNSNGRTLGSLLQGWPKDRIAQFCISSDGADFDVCENYFCVTDADVLQSTLRLRPTKRRTLIDGIKINANSRDGHVVHQKTSFNMFVRSILWDMGLWHSKEFNRWVSDFAPDIVLLQSGESYFMHKLALRIAKNTNAKLATFNTEGYYLFKTDYFVTDGLIGRQIFKVYQKVYNHYFSAFMSRCEKQVYGNKLLRQDYDEQFGSKSSIVLYTSSQLQFKPSEFNRDIPVFSYLGNMGYDRPKALIEFAKTINSINPNYFLDVYGFAKNAEMENMLNNCTAIRFHGAISYQEVIQAMEDSDFLIHVESQDGMWTESLKYGFSTKIADSISSGKIFVLYSSPNIACARYIQATSAGIFASNQSDLKQKIIEVINSAEHRAVIESAARQTAAQNHNYDANSAAMASYLSK